MSCDNTQTTSNSVVDTVKFINRLQKAVVPTEIGCSSCKNPILGETSRANTRPFILYLPNGDPFQLACLCDTQLTTSALPVFRVEDVSGTSCTLRALIQRTSNHDCDEFSGRGYFYPTRTCCTVDLTAFIGIQCLEDEYIPLDPCDY